MNRDSLPSLLLVDEICVSSSAPGPTKASAERVMPWESASSSMLQASLAEVQARISGLDHRFASHAAAHMLDGADLANPHSHSLAELLPSLIGH